MLKNIETVDKYFSVASQSSIQQKRTHSRNQTYERSPNKNKNKPKKKNQNQTLNPLIGIRKLPRQQPLSSG